MLHVSAYSAMRVIPSAMLLYARPVVFGMWLGVLMFIFTAMKIWRGTYQYFKRMPSFISHLLTVLTFFFMSVGALFFMRNPYFNITGRGYTCFLLYGYIDAFAMLFAARALGEGDALFDDDVFNNLVYIVSACVCTSLILVVIIKSRLMVQEYDWMWWSTLTPGEHFSSWVWEDNVYAAWGTDMDDHRANAISDTCIPKYYKHDLRVKEWLDSKWDEWERNPPSWYDDAFLQSLPVEWVPAHLRPERQEGILSRVSSYAINNTKQGLRALSRSASSAPRQVLPDIEEDAE